MNTHHLKSTSRERPLPTTAELIPIPPLEWLKFVNWLLCVLGKAPCRCGEGDGLPPGVTIID